VDYVFDLTVDDSFLLFGGHGRILSRSYPLVG
jgi:hypothetical protein